MEKKKEKKQKKRKKKKGIYRCSLCGELKVGHNCVAVKNCKHLKDKILNYFKNI